MIAVLKHELNSYFHSLTAYVFGAFLLAFTGIGAMLYNIRSSVSNFEYVLSYCSIVLVVIVPILTMRVLAEERKQKTDQLLYSLPISAAQVILGKFLALVLIFLIPVAIICVYPLVFAKYGDVYLLTAYGSLIAFFVMGAALIAVGVFISSLTENQGMAAGIGIAIILVNYFSVSLSEYISSSAYGSLFALCALSVALGFLIHYLTKNTALSYGVSAAAVAATLISYFANPDNMEGMLPRIMTKLSLFKRFESFINGVFDMTSIVFYLSVIAFFLFLSVQSMEKRRYN